MEGSNQGWRVQPRSCAKTVSVSPAAAEAIRLTGGDTPTNSKVRVEDFQEYLKARGYRIVTWPRASGCEGIMSCRPKIASTCRCPSQRNGWSGWMILRCDRSEIVPSGLSRPKHSSTATTALRPQIWHLPHIERSISDFIRLSSSPESQVE